MKLPAIFLNFKTYKEATGSSAVALAKTAGRVAEKTGTNICLVVQAVDILAVAESVALPVYAQHTDPVQYGSNTGKILPEALKEAGALGTVLNHAENKQSDEFVQAAAARAKEAGLEVMLCAETVERASVLASFAPQLVAYEPPELIGGEISVSTAKPELITASVEAVAVVNPEIAIITGAGIKSAVDAKKALELGTKGVFVASGVVKAKNQEQALLELAEALKAEQ